MYINIRDNPLGGAYILATRESKGGGELRGAWRGTPQKRGKGAG